MAQRGFEQCGNTCISDGVIYETITRISTDESDEIRTDLTLLLIQRAEVYKFLYVEIRQRRKHNKGEFVWCQTSLSAVHSVHLVCPQLHITSHNVKSKQVFSSNFKKGYRYHLAYMRAIGVYA